MLAISVSFSIFIAAFFTLLKIPCGFAAMVLAFLTWALAVGSHAWKISQCIDCKLHWGPALSILLIFNFFISPCLVTNFIPNTRFMIFTMKSTSMLPTIRPEEHVVVDLKGYATNAVQRGDLIVFEAPEGNPGLWVMRCAGIPGDVVDIQLGSCFINGEIQEGQIEDSKVRVFQKRPWVLRSDELFCLGDDRSTSRDSRYWGPLPVNAIRGKPIYILWSSDMERTGRRL